MKNDYDAIVIGAGPAGLACGTELADKGLSVALLDEQAGPGGQIYRNITRASKRQHAVLGADYTEGLALVRAFENAPLDYLPRTRVWQAEPTGDVFMSRDGASGKLNARYLVLSTGAMERPVPFPGWILPGVMTCGGISNLFKDASLFPKEPVVVAGSGPLFWLVAKHLFDLNVPIMAILDTTPAGQLVPALKKMPRAARRPGYLMKGVGMIGSVKFAAVRAKVPIYSHVKNLRASGEDRLELVQAECKGRTLRFEVSTLLVHEGVLPNTALLRQAGCKHVWDPVQRYWHPQVTEEGRSNRESVFVAGDGNFVHGAKPAALKGRLTALAIAKEMRRFSKAEYERQSTPLKKELARELLPRPFIDTLYAPRKDLYTLPDDAVVCRCEGITAGRIRELVALGYSDHNEIKAMIRCGMGPCQGRMCGPAINEIVAGSSGLSPVNTRQLRIRPPIKPVSLQEMANAELGGANEN
jgi:thioredoxin reductase/bacterioferritin-associated ferredoxin